MSSAITGDFQWNDEEFAGIQERDGKYYIEVKPNGDAEKMLKVAEMGFKGCQIKVTVECGDLVHLQAKSGQFSQILGHFLWMMKQSTKQFNEVQNLIKMEDEKTQDILHGLELNEISDERAIEIKHMLERNRRERRKFKEETEKMKLFASFAEANKSSTFLKNLSKLDADYQEVVRIQKARDYHPRYIDLVTEEEIPQETEEIPAEEIIAEIEGEKVAKSKKKAV